MNHRLYREFGRATRGERIYQAVAGKRRERTRRIGVSRQGKLVAPLVFQGRCNTAIVDVYFAQVRLPALPPGGGGKVTVSLEYVLSRNRDRVVLRYYEGKIFEYIEGNTNAPAYKVTENFETSHAEPREQGRGRCWPFDFYSSYGFARWGQMV